MQNALKIQSFNSISEPDRMLMLSIEKNDLSRAREALTQGARVHFWYRDKDSLVWAPICRVLKSSSPLEGLDLLYEFGLRAAPVCVQEVADFEGVWLDISLDEPAVVDWLLDHKIGMGLDEGVGSWLCRAAHNFSSPYPGKIMHELHEGGGASHIVPLLFWSSLLLLPGQAASCLVSSAFSEEERKNAHHVINAMPHAFKVLDLLRETLNPTQDYQLRLMLNSSLAVVGQQWNGVEDLTLAFECMTGLGNQLGHAEAFWKDQDRMKPIATSLRENQASEEKTQQFETQLNQFASQRIFNEIKLATEMLPCASKARRSL